MLRTLSVKNFRNLNINRLDIKPGVTVVVGDNGQGKTNLLEAIYYLSYGKSFRGTKAQAISWKKDNAYIVGEAGRYKIELRINRNEENTALINGKQKRLALLLGCFVSVIFHPEGIETISGPPGLRRAWLDKLISTTDKSYLYDLINYQKALRSKNSLLKKPQSDEWQLEVWNKNLAGLGCKIWQKRDKAIGNINHILKGESNKLIGEKLTLDYTNPMIGKSGVAGEGFYLKILEAQKKLEKRLQATVFGPHRDDFRVVKEEIRNKTILQKELSGFGSRAEQRQAVLLLKIAEGKIYNDYFEEAPSILLDDVASELDKKNRELFLTRLWSRQAFITTTSLELLPEEVRKKSQVFKMEKGTLKPI